MGVVDEGDDVLFGEIAVVDYFLFILRKLADSLDEFFRIHLAEFLDGVYVLGGVVGAVGHIAGEAREVSHLIGFVIGSHLADLVNEAGVGVLVGNCVGEEILKQAYSLGQVLAEAGDYEE